MLIDDITIRIQSGQGGDGMVAFNGNVMAKGPTGGSGGQGGNIYFEAVSDLDALNRLRHQKVFKAEAGQNGKRQFNDGHSAEDLTIYVPAGTVVHNLTLGLNHELVQVGERFLAAVGGRGGRGNYHFRSSRNTTPTQSEPGAPSEKFTVRLELKMIADIGLVGLPNTGKSSLLNELTNAKSKVANYHFTTLEPNLGVYYGLILADIPGLIEDASKNKGLGVKFLRHIERTRILFHIVSAESEDPVKDYKIIRQELGAYSKTLLDKEEYVFLSKTDLVSNVIAKKKLAQLKKLNSKTSLLSIHDADAIAGVEKVLNKIIKQKIPLTE